MPDRVDGQLLIESFFDAVRLRRLEECQRLLETLEVLTEKQPSLKLWHKYLQGILAFEIQHDWAKAERTFTELLQTELEPELRGRALYALGRSLDIQGRWEEAIATFEQNLLLATELEQPLQKAKAWKHMAISYRRAFTQADFGPQVLQQAITYCKSALEALEPIADPSPEVDWLRGSVWNTLGLIYRSLGEWDQAITCYQQDLAFCRALDDRHGIGLTYINLGEIYQKCGSWPEAMTAYRQALSLTREFENRYYETETLANLGFLYQDMGNYKQALDHYQQAVQVIEQLRTVISSEESRAGFFATTVDTYANTVLLCLELGNHEMAFNIVEKARSRAFLDMLVAQRGSHAPSPNNIEATTMTLAEVQNALPADGVLIEYFTTGLVEASERRAVSRRTPERHRFPPSKTLVFAITREELRVHDINLSPNDLRPRQLNSVVERHFLEHQIRRSLYDRLIAPVQELIQNKHRLYVVPHGPLHYIPFQALIAPDGDTLLRQTGPQVIYAPSATLLFRYGRQGTNQLLLPCLALGYNGQAETQLRFAEDEARSIAGLTMGQALVGTSPKKKALYNQAANYRLLHFSCHGDFDPVSPLASALHLAPGESLTALDVLDYLRLRCDLVTLSACESGLSRVRRGDELVGLMRAFMYAGAPALVSTLWRVDERSTAILMGKFYQEIQAGTGFAEALKRAQLYVRNLTRREIVDILRRFLVSAPAAPDSSPLVDKGSASVEGVEMPRQQARAYLKGPATSRLLLDEEAGHPEERIFADPYYWASFILVGDPGSETSGIE